MVKEYNLIQELQVYQLLLTDTTQTASTRIRFRTKGHFQVPLKLTILINNERRTVEELDIKWEAPV